MDTEPNRLFILEGKTTQKRRHAKKRKTFPPFQDTGEERPKEASSSINYAAVQPVLALVFRIRATMRP